SAARRSPWPARGIARPAPEVLAALPQVRRALRREIAAQLGAALRFQHARRYVDVVICRRGAEDVDRAACRTPFGVAATEDEARDTGGNDGAGAHDARLLRYVQRRP